MTDSSSPATLPSQILDRIAAEPVKVWTPRDFADTGSRDAVDKALQRLAKSGELHRIERGLYGKPHLNKLTGKPSAPDYRAVIDAVARREKARFVVDGMTAANTLGMTNAVPAKIKVLVDARLKPIKMGNQKIVFKHAAPSRLYWARRPGMYLVQALHWIHDTMQAETERSKVDQIVRKLLNDRDKGPKLADDLRIGLSAMPIWMQDILRGPIMSVGKANNT